MTGKWEPSIYTNEEGKYLGLHVPAVQLVNGKSQIPPFFLQLQSAVLEVLRKTHPQGVLIRPVGDEAVGIVLIVGEGEGVGQIVGQLAQGVVRWSRRMWAFM